MPILSSTGAASSRGFGSGNNGNGPIILTGTYYGGYSTMPTSLVESNGVAKIVFNGYGLLLYGWQSTGTTTGMRSFSLPSGLLGKQVDITFIGGGGYHYGGGGGGGGGAGGGRHLVTIGNLTAYLKTGTHFYSSPYASSNSVGVDEWRNTRLYLNGGADNLFGPHAGESTGSTASGGNVYNYTGPNSSGTASLNSSNAGNLAFIQSKDSTFQYCYAGAGVYLNGFGTGYPNGSDLGGGGGAQDHGNYGGSTSPGTGGRYGYSGGLRDAAGNGPVGGLRAGSGSYRKGGGGSFGAGVGDAGNNDSEPTTPGGGGILIRWDTTLATFQTGTPGWP